MHKSRYKNVFPWKRMYIKKCKHTFRVEFISWQICNCSLPSTCIKLKKTEICRRSQDYCYCCQMHLVKGTIVLKRTVCSLQNNILLHVRYNIRQDSRMEITQIMYAWLWNKSISWKENLTANAEYCKSSCNNAISQDTFCICITGYINYYFYHRYMIN